MVNGTLTDSHHESQVKKLCWWPSQQSLAEIVHGVAGFDVFQLAGTYPIRNVGKQS